MLNLQSNPYKNTVCIAALVVLITFSTQTYFWTCSPEINPTYQQKLHRRVAPQEQSGFHLSCLHRECNTLRPLRDIERNARSAETGTAAKMSRAGKESHPQADRRSKHFRISQIWEWLRMRLHRESEPATERKIPGYPDPTLEQITQRLEKAVAKYYQKVMRLAVSGRSQRHLHALRIVDKTVSVIFNKYQDAILETVPEAQQVLKAQGPTRRVSFDDAYKILEVYYFRQGKFFVMCRLDTELEGTFISSLHHFILADIVEVSGGKREKPHLPIIELEPEEIAVENIRINFLCEFGAFLTAHHGQLAIVYNLDLAKKEADDCWKILNDFPEPLTLEETVEFIQGEKTEKCGERVTADLLRAEFGDCLSRGQDDFRTRYLAAQRNVAGIHEIAHLGLSTEQSPAEKEIMAFLVAVGREAVAYWGALGYSNYPYLVLINMIDTTTRATTPSRQLANPHFQAVQLDLNAIIGDIRCNPQKYPFVCAEAPEGLKDWERGLFYIAQFYRISRQTLIELGKRNLTVKIVPEADRYMVGYSLMSEAETPERMP